VRPARALHRRLPKRSKEETRELMLRAASDLLRRTANAEGDAVVAAALAHVRLTDIADRATELVRAELAGSDPQRAAAARVSTGAIYQLWPRQADFQADLLFYIAEHQAELNPPAEKVLEQCRAEAEDGVPFVHAVVTVVQDSFAYYRDDPLFRVELSFLMAASDPRVAAALAHRHRRLADGADQLWSHLLDIYGRRMRHPYQVADLTTAVAAQISGSVVLWWAEPTRLADPHGDPRLTLACRATALLLEAMTEPVESEPVESEPVESERE
jgi:hypothetical protein